MNFLDLNTILQNVQAKAQQYANDLLDFSVGKVWNTFANVVADNTNYLQSLALQVLGVTRLSSSSGTDVDSFIADFNFSRLGSVTASGQATFGRYSGTSPTNIPVNTNIKTLDGQLTYYVAVDPTNPTWDNVQNAYVMNTGVVTVTVPIVAAAAGTAYNVQANTITLISTPLPDVNFVTNLSAITNGVDAESDSAVKTRFWQYLNTRSLATVGAVEYAITSTQSGLTYNIVEEASGRPGYFTVYIDDGTGNPLPSLLANVVTNIEAVRPLTVTYSVFPCTVEWANISLNIFAATGYDKQTLIGNVNYAITALINGLGVSAPLNYFDVAMVARSVEGVSKIENLYLNSGIQDIGGGPTQSVHLQNLAIG